MTDEIKQSLGEWGTIDFCYCGKKGNRYNLELNRLLIKCLNTQRSGIQLINYSRRAEKMKVLGYLTPNEKYRELMKNSKCCV